MSSNSKRTVADLVEAYGGTTAFGRIIGKGPSTASEMKRVGRIDPKYWTKIVVSARERGPQFDWVTPEALMQMHAPQPQEAAE
jgi:hypothetical protein